MVARFRGFAFDSERRQVTRGADEIHLTAKAFDLLTLLLAEAPRVVRKAEIHKQLWPGSFVSDATLVSLVKELRRELKDRDASDPIIRTAHGVGYAFAAPLDQPSDAGSELTRWILAGRRRIALRDGENLIGRDPAATVCLDAPGVSRRHARILVSGDHTLLEDLGSKNGTSVREEPVSGRVRLEDGDRLAIGPIVVIFHYASAGIPTETVPGSLLARRKPRRNSAV